MIESTMLRSFSRMANFKAVVQSYMPKWASRFVEIISRFLGIQYRGFLLADQHPWDTCPMLFPMDMDAKKWFTSRDRKMEGLVKLDAQISPLLGLSIFHPDVTNCSHLTLRGAKYCTVGPDKPAASPKGRNSHIQFRVGKTLRFGRIVAIVYNGRLEEPKQVAMGARLVIQPYEEMSAQDAAVDPYRREEWAAFGARLVYPSFQEFLTINLEDLVSHVAVYTYNQSEGASRLLMWPLDRVSVIALLPELHLTYISPSELRSSKSEVEQVASFTLVSGRNFI